MTGMNLYEALTDIEDQYILDASENVRKQRSQTWVKRLMIAAAAVIILLAAGAVLNGQLRKADKGKQEKIFGTKEPADELTCAVSRDDVELILDYLETAECNTSLLIDAEYRPEYVKTDMIKRVNLMTGNFITEYRENSTYKSWMGDIWQYKVPVESEESLTVITLIKTEDGMMFVESVTGEKDSPTLQKFVTDESKIEKILQDNGFSKQNILSENYLIAYMCRTLFYAFTTEQGEFVLPFSDLLDEENKPVFVEGKVYTPEEAVDYLEKFQCKSNKTSDGHFLYGGLGTYNTASTSQAESKNTRFNPLWIILFSVGIGFSVSLIVMLSKGKVSHIRKKDRCARKETTIYKA